MGSVVGYNLGWEIEKGEKSQPWMKCSFGINLMNVLSGSTFRLPQEDTNGAVGGT